MPTRQMKLGLFIRPGGHHIACWRHPRAQADAGVNFPHFVEMAQIAERGLFDMLFSADNHTVWTVSDSAIDLVHYSNWLEPYTLLSALSGYTKNIGLVCTASTSFEQPYAVARKFATLDLISGGRSGWNVVTSGNETEAQNFSKVPHLPKADRYRRGREFVDVVRALWDSWDEGASTFSGRPRTSWACRRRSRASGRQSRSSRAPRRIAGCTRPTSRPAIRRSCTGRR